MSAKQRRDREAVKRAMKEPDVSAFLKIVGYLLPLSERARARVLRFVTDRLDEQNAEERS